MKLRASASKTHLSYILPLAHTMVVDAACVVSLSVTAQTVVLPSDQGMVLFCVHYASMGRHPKSL